MFDRKFKTLSIVALPRIKAAWSHAWLVRTRAVLAKAASEP